MQKSSLNKFEYRLSWCHLFCFCCQQIKTEIDALQNLHETAESQTNPTWDAWHEAPLPLIGSLFPLSSIPPSLLPPPRLNSWLVCNLAVEERWIIHPLLRGSEQSDGPTTETEGWRDDKRVSWGREEGHLRRYFHRFRQKEKEKKRGRLEEERMEKRLF